MSKYQQGFRVRYVNYCSLGEPPVKGQNQVFDFEDHQSRVCMHTPYLPLTCWFQVPRSETSPHKLELTEKIQQTRKPKDGQKRCIFAFLYSKLIKAFQFCTFSLSCHKARTCQANWVTLLPASMMKDAGPLHRNPVSILWFKRSEAPPPLLPQPKLQSCKERQNPRISRMNQHAVVLFITVAANDCIADGKHTQLEYQ